MKLHSEKRWRRIRTKSLPLLVLGATGIIVVTAIWFFNRPPAPKYSGPIDHISTGDVGEYSALSIIAQERGYFKEYGLDVTMKEYSSGPPAVADMLAGKIDTATAADFVGTIDSFDNPNLRILATQEQAYSFFMASRRDHGIMKPADLSGKKIGVTRNTAGEFYLGDFLVLNQLRLQDVTTVNGTPNKLVAELESGQLDAIVSFDPHIYDVQKKLGNNAIVWSMQGDEALSSLLYGTADLVKNRPEAVKRYLQALVAAESFTQSHNAQAEQIVGKYLGYDSAYMQRIWPRLTFNVSLDEYLLISMEEQARWAIENNVTDATQIPDFLQIVYFRGLEAAKPDGITMVH